MSIEKVRKYDELLGKLGLQVISQNHVDIPDTEIFCTERNTSAEKIHINYHDNNQTLRDYQTLKKLNNDKEFILHL